MSWLGPRSRTPGCAPARFGGIDETLLAVLAPRDVNELSLVRSTSRAT